MLFSHLTTFEMDPGFYFGSILREAFEAQIEGVFGNSRLDWLYKKELI